MRIEGIWKMLDEKSPIWRSWRKFKRKIYLIMVLKTMYGVENRKVVKTEIAKLSAKGQVVIQREGSLWLY